MKINKFFLSLAGATMLFASCGTEDLELGDSSTSPVDANCPAVEFAANNSKSFEVDPSAASFNLTVVRRDSVKASYDIVVVSNEDDAFNVPAKVDFEEKEFSKDITITMKDGAKQGEPLALELTFNDAVMNPYTTGLKTISVKSTIIKWESFGTGYLLGHLINEFFGASTLPLAVEIEKATTASATKYRFDSPYASVCTAQDELGAYIGYPYNEAGDVTGVVEKFVITVTKDGASLAPVNMGLNWGYGEFSTGSIYGYLSQNIADYPLGVYTPSETGGVITFGPGSLYISMADYNNGKKYPCEGATVLYLSAADYMAASEE